MSNKIKIILSMLIVFLLISIIFIKFNSGYSISITNNTDITITNLELKYKVGNSISIIPQIKPKKCWKDKIDTNNIQGENSIIIIYKDNIGNSYEDTVVGYLEKGYSGQVNVIINKIHENGKLEIDIN